MQNIDIKELDDKSVLELLNFDMTPLPKERDSILLMFYRFFRHTCFVAYQNKQLVGVLLAVPDAVQSGHVYLHYLVVSAEKRGLGIGESIMVRFMESMKKQHIKRVSLMTSNPKNESFYKRFGFHRVEETYDNCDLALDYIRDKKKMLLFIANLE